MSAEINIKHILLKNKYLILILSILFASYFSFNYYQKNSNNIFINYSVKFNEGNEFIDLRKEFVKYFDTIGSLRYILLEQDIKLDQFTIDLQPVLYSVYIKENIDNKVISHLKKNQLNFNLSRKYLSDKQIQNENYFFLNNESNYIIFQKEILNLNLSDIDNFKEFIEYSFNQASFELVSEYTNLWKKFIDLYNQKYFENFPIYSYDDLTKLYLLDKYDNFLNIKSPLLKNKKLCFFLHSNKTNFLNNLHKIYDFQASINKLLLEAEKKNKVFIRKYSPSSEKSIKSLYVVQDTIIIFIINFVLGLFLISLIFCYVNIIFKKVK